MTPKETLKKYFGYDNFRGAQEEIIDHILNGENVLGVMPTGAGKSICYQVPSIIKGGTTLVISPLIALMQDQDDFLKTLGVKSIAINSTLTEAKKREALKSLGESKFDVVFCSPERFRDEIFMDIIKNIEISLFVVDEAHCISQWGHSFRLEYTQLGEVREMLGNPVTLALTATATPVVQDEIIELLKLDPDKTITKVSGFERPNLSFSKIPVFTKTKDRAVSVNAVLKDKFKPSEGGVAMVYCPTVKMVDEIHEALSNHWNVGKYYATDMKMKDREKVQEDWMNGKYDVLVCTKAFGMGIDKPNVRLVIHSAIPDSLESYYQEAGRAGRDGGESECILLFNEDDIKTQQWFIDCSFPPKDIVEACWDYLLELDEKLENGFLSKVDPKTEEEIMYAYKDSKELVVPKLDTPELSKFVSSQTKYFTPYAVATSLLRILHQAKVLVRKTKYFDVSINVPKQNLDRDFELPVDWEYLRNMRKRDMELLSNVVNYSYNSKICRQQYLINYFNKKSTTYTCGKCDNCKRNQKR